jgi:hypothetical protein
MKHRLFEALEVVGLLLGAALLFVSCSGPASPSGPSEGATVLSGIIRGNEAVRLTWLDSYCPELFGDWEAQLGAQVTRGVEKAISDDGVGAEAARAVSFNGFRFQTVLAQGRICGLISGRTISLACNCDNNRHPFDWVGWEARNQVCLVTKQCVAY